MAKKATIKAALAGAGRKRPQINIPIDRLEVDDQNPRILEEDQQGTQLDLIRTLYEGFDLEEIAFSMAANGYFDEEPVVVVPKSIPKGYTLDPTSTVEEQQRALEQLIEDTEITFVVVEGNRRTATAKLLLDAGLRRKVEVGGDFPTNLTEGVRADLQIIPAIVYPNRSEVSPYLGVRHISGVLRWEAYAIAKYIADRIESDDLAGLDLKQRIKRIQEQIGDRSDVIRKQYIFYKLIEQAEEAGLNVRPVKSRFSLVSVALAAPAIRAYIGLGALKDVDLAKPLIPEKSQENLGKVIAWIFGNGRDKKPVITDSRLISRRLAPILDDPEATAVLERTQDVELAYEMSGGEQAFVIKKIDAATRNIEAALSKAYKYKNDEAVQDALRLCVAAVEQLSQMLG